MKLTRIMFRLGSKIFSYDEIIKCVYKEEENIQKLEISCLGTTWSKATM